MVWPLQRGVNAKRRTPKTSESAALRDEFTGGIARLSGVVLLERYLVPAGRAAKVLRPR